MEISARLKEMGMPYAWLKTFAPRNRANQASLQNECTQMKFSNDLSFRSIKNRPQAPKALHITLRAQIIEALIEARHKLAHAELLLMGSQSTNNSP